MSETAHYSKRSHTCAVLYAVVAAVACFFLYTTYNQFPYSWHPDEIAKARLILEERNSFFHPLLLLGASRMMVRLCGIDSTPQAIVETGRVVSAAYAALAVAVFAHTAFILRGWLASVVASLFIGLSWALIVNAHYMKEDTALLLGIALCFWAIAATQGLRVEKRALFLGCVCGLATSGKYIGVITVLMSFIVLWKDIQHGNREVRRRLIKVFILGFGLVFLAINAPLFFSFRSFASGLANEIKHVAFAGHDSVRLDMFNLDNIKALLRQVIFPIQILLVGYYWTFFKRHNYSTPEGIIAFFPFLYFLLLSLAFVHQPRYLLPVSVTFYFCAALYVSDFLSITSMPRWLRGSAICIVVGGIVGMQSSKAADVLGQFRNDSRYVITEWMKANLPAYSTVAVENFAGILDPQMRDLSKIPGKAINFRSVYMIGEQNSIERLRSEGVTHVIANELMYRRFFNPNLIPREGVKLEFERAKKLYEDVFAETPLWQMTNDSPLDAFTNPTLALYDIREIR